MEIIFEFRKIFSPMNSNNQKKTPIKNTKHQKNFQNFEKSQTKANNAIWSFVSADTKKLKIVSTNSWRFVKQKIPYTKKYLIFH